ncbi:isoprenylcysteine carboxylmethyltransferase family protein [Aquibium sp. ELW1220]|jgi:protein-S-isoprenylcysteine O-methyltransferase Ste14|uniref:methyltransferase family protein n=1 Tax=Aquibium sp. ELW1220 TaxID=2976766 RepID=UPI0025B20244|nr:isoprenylcysteine carboxylmethyltransferase family protein [Aquibium sp. ELW1220]MDN2581907.1 isoprenylcysteine carboxylmethyltransferase family protein [Aquibium sp. ELW1220]
MASTGTDRAGGATPAGQAALREELDTYQRRRRIVLAASILLLAPILLLGQSAFPPGTIFQESLEMLGILMIFLGIVGRLWSTLYIGGRKGMELVTGGPYSVTRNPLYIFSTLAVAGIGAQTGSIVATLCFAAISIAALHVVIRREERYLRQALGGRYGAYCARVPRFWPRWSLYEEGAVGVVDPRRLRQTLFDGLFFFLAVPAFDLLDRAQSAGTLPVLFRLP